MMAQHYVVRPQFGGAQEASNRRDAKGYTALHSAVLQSNPASVQMLLQTPGVHPDVQATDGSTALHIALRQAARAAAAQAGQNPNVQMVDVIIAHELLKAGCRIDVPDGERLTAIQLACDLPWNQHTGTILSAMARGAGAVAQQDRGPGNPFNVLGPVKGMGPVHMVGTMDERALLVHQRGADINMQTRDGMLATTLTAQAGNSELLLALVQQLGADPLRMGSDGTSAVWHVMRPAPENRFPPEEAQRLLKALISSPSAGSSQHLAQWPIVSKAGILQTQQPALHAACAISNLKAVQLLLSHGIPIHAVNAQNQTPLHVAVLAHIAQPSQASLDVVVHLLSLGAECLREDIEGKQPLALAMNAGSLEMLTAMVHHHRQLANVYDGLGRTILYTAIQRGHVDFVRELIQKYGASGGQSSRAKWIPLHVAVAYGRLDIVGFLLADIRGRETLNVPDGFGMRALTYLWRPWELPGEGSPPPPPAASAQGRQLLELLASQPGIDVNYVDGSGKSPLHWAVATGDIDTIKRLAALPSTDPNMRDGESCTVLCSAVRMGKLKIVQILLQNWPTCIELDAPSPAGPGAGGLNPNTPLTPLHCALHACLPEVAAFLAGLPNVGLDMTCLELALRHIDKRPQECAAMLRTLLDPRSANRCTIKCDNPSYVVPFSGLPPLHTAAVNDAREIVELLLSRAGARVGDVDSKGRTALHVAVAAHAYNAAAALVAAGADICAQAQGGLSTPLVTAADAQDVPMLKLLLSTSTKFDINAADMQGRTALCAAVHAALNAHLDHQQTLNMQQQQQVIANGPAAGGTGQSVGSEDGTAHVQAGNTGGSASGMASMDSAGASSSLGKPLQSTSSNMQGGPLRGSLVADSATSMLHSSGGRALSTALSSSSAVLGGTSSAQQPPRSAAALKDAVAFSEEVVFRVLQAGADPNIPITLPASMMFGGSILASGGSSSMGGSSAALQANGGAAQSAFQAAATACTTPLLAAIEARAQRLVNILLREGKGIAVNGAAPNAVPLHVAVRVLSQIAEAAPSTGAATRQQAPGVVRGFMGSMLKSEKSKSAAAHAAAADQLARSQHAASITAALSVLGTLVADARTDLCVLHPVSRKSALVQLAGIGGEAGRSAVASMVRLAGPTRPFALNAPGSDGKTALHIAAERGDAGMVEVLAALPDIDYSVVDASGMTALAHAVAAGSRDAVAKLVACASSNLAAAAPLDLCASGPDPARSPMALAVLLPAAAAEAAAPTTIPSTSDTQMLAALLEAIKQHNTTVGTANAPVGFPGTGFKTVMPGKQVDVYAVVNSFVDKQMRTALQVAAICQQLSHMEMLVKAGARLDVQERSSEWANPCVAAAAAPGVAGIPVAAGATGSRPNTIHLTPGSTPVHILINYCAELYTTKERVHGAGEARQVARGVVSAMMAMPSAGLAVCCQNALGQTPLHLAVIAGIKLVLMVAPVARAAGALDLMETQKNYTALHTAAVLNQVKSAEALLEEGATPQLAGKDNCKPVDLATSNDMKKMLTKQHKINNKASVVLPHPRQLGLPPAVVVVQGNGAPPPMPGNSAPPPMPFNHSNSVPAAAGAMPAHQMAMLTAASAPMPLSAVPGTDLPVVKASLHAGGPNNSHNSANGGSIASASAPLQLQTAPSNQPGIKSSVAHAMSVPNVQPQLDFAGRSLGGNDAADRPGPSSRVETAEMMYGGFVAALKVAAGAGEALGPLGKPIAAVCQLGVTICAAAEQVVLNNNLVRHMADRIKLLLPTLKELQKACQTAELLGTTSSATPRLLEHLSFLGRLFIDIREAVSSWSGSGTWALIKRLGSANDFKIKINDLNNRLTDVIQSLNTVVVTSNLLNQGRFTPKGEDPEEVRRATQEAARADLVMMVRDVLDGEAWGHEMNNMSELYKQYGLNLVDLKKAQRRRWKEDRLRGLEVPRKDVQLVTELGRKEGSAVYVGWWQDMQVAVKMFETGINAQGNLRKEVENEGYIMSTLRHPNICQFYGIISEDKCAGLLLGYYPFSLNDVLFGANSSSSSSLQQHPQYSAVLKELQQSWGLTSALKMALQVAHGMCYLHERGTEPVVHGKLQPSNIMITAVLGASVKPLASSSSNGSTSSSSNGNAAAASPAPSTTWRAVITDFGLARVMNATTLAPTTRMSGHNAFSTPAAIPVVYTAPEVFAEGGNLRKRTPACDVFGFGVLLLELCTRKHAYEGWVHTPDEYAQGISEGRRPPLPSQLRAEVNSMVSRCWAQNPADRPSFSVLVDELSTLLQQLHDPQAAAAPASSSAPAPKYPVMSPVLKW